MPRPGPDSPIVALDIDGTSGDYHGHFTKFIEAWTGKSMPDPTEYTGGVPFWQHLGVSRSTYRQAKLAFRQGGLKRSMPVYEGIGDFTRYVRTNGVQVWICTTRPYLSLSNIEPDTKHWLTKRARMQYDNVLFGHNKYRDLVKSVGRNRVVLVYDDLPEMIEQATSLGLHAVLRLQPYNMHWHTSNGIVGTATSIDHYRAHFDEQLTIWRKNHAWD